LANGDQFIDAAAEQMAALFRERHDQIIALIERTERMAAQLIGRPAVFVLCHADIHAFNVLIDRHDKLWVVDWDTLILAPPERDLMFIGAGIGGIWDQQREAELFYQGYGTVSVDPIALSYYRAERIVQDLVSYGEYVFLSAEGGADRAEAVRQVAGQFLPGGVIDLI
jgi:spectinomycin phosphotransferase